MSGTYRAWNGKTYPWPPPDGWYRADDDRWWAPGSGPNPPPFHRQSTSQRSPGSAVRRRPRPPGPPAEESAGETGDDTEDLNDGATSRKPPTPTPAPRPDTSALARSTASHPVSAPQNRGGRRAPRLAVVAAAMALAALTMGAVVGLLTAIGDGDGDGSRLGTIDTTTTPTGATPEGSDTDAGVSSTEADRSTLTAGSDSPTPGSAPDASATTPTTSATTDGPVSEPRTADERTEKVARFRELVTVEALRSDPLSDEDIEDLAVAVCVIASVEDTTGFATARAQIATEQATGGTLSADRLSGTINDAVRAFCPAEAARLGF